VLKEKPVRRTPIKGNDCHFLMYYPPPNVKAHERALARSVPPLVGLIFARQKVVTG
jgi:hypothetical protein